MPSFLMNYGGPTSALTSIESSFDKILHDCVEYYTGSPKATGFSLEGLDITYYQIGIHRMMKVTLPDSVSEDLKSNDPSVRLKAQTTKDLYRKVRISASNFNTEKYKLLGNNCVSACANILNTIDPSILDGQKKIIPGFLDAKVKSLVKPQVDLLEVLNVQKDSMDDSHGVPAQNLYSSTAATFWSDVMTDVGKNSSFKQQLSDMKPAQDKEVQNPLEENSSPSPM